MAVESASPESLLLVGEVVDPTAGSMGASTVVAGGVEVVQVHDEGGAAQVGSRAVAVTSWRCTAASDVQQIGL